jgi:iron-sulfur cluster assembly protein
MSDAAQKQGQESAAANPAAGSAPSGSMPASSNVLQVSERAAAQVKQIQERENKQGTFLRVGVIGGGCSGLSYKLSFDETTKEKDKIIEAHGIKLAIDGKSALFLRGTILDFTDGLNGQGFVFTNPNAKSTCGCGSSFSA